MTSTVQVTVDVKHQIRSKVLLYKSETKGAKRLHGRGSMMRSISFL